MGGVLYVEPLVSYPTCSNALAMTHILLLSAYKTEYKYQTIKSKCIPLTTWMFSPLLGFHILNVASSEPVQIVLPEVSSGLKHKHMKHLVYEWWKKRINFVYCTIRGKITASHTTTMTRKHVKKGTFVRIPHPHCRILWTSQDYMSSWMPPDPLSSHSYSINTLTMWQQSHRHEISPQCLLQDRRVYTWDGENLCPRFGQFRPSFQMQATVHQYWRLSYTQNFHDLDKFEKASAEAEVSRKLAPIYAMLTTAEEVHNVVLNVYL